MILKFLGRGFCIGTLFTASGLLHANTLAEQAPENSNVSTSQFQQALPDIITFSEFVHRVRYFYPSEAVSQTIWSYFLEKTINEMVELPQRERLEYAFAQLKKIAPHISTQPSDLPAVKNNEVARTWVATGARNVTAYERNLESGIFSELVNNVETPKSKIYSDVYGNQPVYWPLYLNSQDSLSGETFRPPNPKQSSLMNPATCMAALSSMWAEIYHFWPYFEQVTVKWEDSHVALLEGCLDDPKNLQSTINIEFKKLQDNHVFIALPNEFRNEGVYQLPIGLDYIESKAIVTSKTDYISLQIEIGDELVSIDGVAVEELIQAATTTIPKSDHAAVLEATTGLTRNYKSPNLVELTFRKPSGETVTTTTATIHQDVIGDFHSHAVAQPLVQELGNGVVRLNVFDIGTQAQVNEAKEALKNAAAIVLDMRGYPRNFMLVREFMGYFSDIETAVGPFYHHSQRAPNQEDIYVHSFKVGVPLNEKLFDVPTVAISSKFNMSAGEHFLMIAQNLNMPIVGEITSGINGDYVFGGVFSGPAYGGIYYFYTGARSDQVDGSKLIGVGIKPDYLVPVTQASTADNVDIQLNKAHQVVLEMLAQ
ncbi:S41 family peptidase [Pseudoalteromonas luteoviolacea]|uniref:Periplasmic protease n=1 Tax=Pseudoalteromonas luteoviolacea (strain 2ta16) TaxID=1353533 RepID=V4HA26_PSEL2|nr:S41 family peptidase [Pseudoalteromonas luteoviolacea]ESP94301.1 periplasmic protease [Pseudoalteromonas luteoviolacea 2ta16]KZN36157.1 hypothetical protein N483_23110 [Pseudoalteromonas luteoviolacea NCIMB 1944]